MDTLSHNPLLTVVLVLVFVTVIYWLVRAVTRK